MEGSIIKGVGGFYYVSTDQGVITCKAKGAFRREGITPVVGDRVRITRHDSGYAQIDEVLPRRNLLIRPAVANIDRLLIVLSGHLPEPDWLLADKLIVQATLNRIEPVMVLNKADEAEDAIVKAFEEDYRLFPRVVVSALSGEGLQGLKDAIAGKVPARPAVALLRRRAAGHPRLLPLRAGELRRAPAAGLLPGVQGGRALPIPGLYAHQRAGLRREGPAVHRPAIPRPI